MDEKGEAEHDRRERGAFKLLKSFLSQILSRLDLHHIMVQRFQHILSSKTHWPTAAGTLSVLWVQSTTQVVSWTTVTPDATVQCKVVIGMVG